MTTDRPDEPAPAKAEVTEQAAGPEGSEGAAAIERPEGAPTGNRADARDAKNSPELPAADASFDDQAEPAEALEPLPELTEQALEALLFVAERPLSRRELSTLSGADPETVDARLGDLEVALADRGIRLIRNGERVELATAPEAGTFIARYVGAEASPRLSPAALETLAIVAYGQPMTKAGIERIRGVDSDYTIRVLLHRRLVAELGRSESPGRPFLYGTSFDFLERFGLTSIEELPVLGADTAARIADVTDIAAAGQVTLGLGGEPVRDA